MLIFCNKSNIDEKTNWGLPGQVTDIIKKTGRSGQITIQFQHISWIPQEFKKIEGNRGIIVTSGWNGSFHERCDNCCVVVFEIGKRAGRIGRTRNAFKVAMEKATKNKKDKIIEKFKSRQMVRFGD